MLLVENGGGVARLGDVSQVVEVVGQSGNGADHGAADVEIDDAEEERGEGGVERAFDQHQERHRLLFHEVVDGPEGGPEQQVLERIGRDGHAKVDDGRGGRHGHHRQRQRGQTAGEDEGRAEIEAVPRLLVVAGPQGRVDGHGGGDGEEHGAGQAAVE